jgi:predicted nucleic acid-binding protein
VVSLFHIKAALQNEERYKIPFWDALILAAAKSGGAAILYSEALQDGQKYGTVLVRNPFRSRQVEAKPQGSSSSPL